MFFEGINGDLRKYGGSATRQPLYAAIGVIALMGAVVGESAAINDPGSHATSGSAALCPSQSLRGSARRAGGPR
jgi:hypothetical protein